MVGSALNLEYKSMVVARCSVVGFRTSWTTTSSPCSRDVGAAKWDGLRRRFGTRLRRRRRAKLPCCESFGTSQPALNCADFTAEAVPAMRGYSFPPHRGSGYIVATPQSFNFWLASPSSHLRSLAGALRVVPLSRCAVVRERGLSSGRVGLASGGYLGT